MQATVKSLGGRACNEVGSNQRLTAVGAGGGGTEETTPLLQEGIRKSRRKWSASRPTRGELGKCTYKATSSNSHGNKMEGFELCFHFLIFRFFIYSHLSVSGCQDPSLVTHTASQDFKIPPP